MKRDLSVLLSIVLIVGAWFIGELPHVPRTITEDSPTLQSALLWTVLLGFIRAQILWFQTLIHGVKYSKEENRVAVVLAHVCLGPLMAYAYYFSIRPETMQSEENQELVADTASNSE